MPTNLWTWVSAIVATAIAALIVIFALIVAWKLLRGQINLTYLHAEPARPAPGADPVEALLAMPGNLIEALAAAIVSRMFSEGRATRLGGAQRLASRARHGRPARAARHGPAIASSVADAVARKLSVASVATGRRRRVVGSSILDLDDRQLAAVASAVAAQLRGAQAAQEELPLDRIEI
jgi:hypothetical protein